jgi:hypothetical protein
MQIIMQTNPTVKHRVELQILGAKLFMSVTIKNKKIKSDQEEIIHQLLIIKMRIKTKCSLSLELFQDKQMLILK